MKYFLGIDIGTSGCKAVIFDEGGNQASGAYRGYDVISPQPGWAELWSDEVTQKCFEVIRETAVQLEFGSVAGIGISSQGEAFTIVDNEGKALCNALVSSDVRANDLISPWTEKFGEEKLYRITGHTPHPMFSLFKLLWMKEKEPGTWQKAHKIMCFEDLLQYRLGIKDPAISFSLAARTMLFDITGKTWSGEILKAAGISASLLSRPLQSGTIAGTIDRKIADELGLGENTFVVTGGHDQPCCGLGAGAIRPGVAVYSSGTVECITPAFPEPVFSDILQKNNLCTYHHCAPGMYATVAFSLTGGNMLKWFRDEFGAEETAAAQRTGQNPYQVMIDRMPGEPSKLLALPYFTPSGTPYFDVNTKGAILGLDFSATREDILRALLEGVAFEVRLNLDILRQSGYRVDELRIIGGGASSLKHVQLKSDVVGMPVTVTGVTEAGCMGAAMLAYSAYSGTGVSVISEKWVRPVSRVEPGNKDVYDRKFAAYCDFYHLLKNFRY